MTTEAGDIMRPCALSLPAYLSGTNRNRPLYWAQVQFRQDRDILARFLGIPFPIFAPWGFVGLITEM
jgi:hypothetical protein